MAVADGTVQELADGSSQQADGHEPLSAIVNSYDMNMFKRLRGANGESDAKRDLRPGVVGSEAHVSDPVSITTGCGERDDAEGGRS
jgi:hypothetical protein